MRLEQEFARLAHLRMVRRKSAEQLRIKARHLAGRLTGCDDLLVGDQLSCTPRLKGQFAIRPPQIEHS